MPDPIKNLKNQEWQRIYEATAIEREWWPKETKFLDEEEEQAGLGTGRLVKLEREGSGWRLIGQLNGRPDGEPNTIRPEALELLKAIIGEWQASLGKTGEKAAAAVTSLYRTLRHQQAMDPSLAVGGTDSSHLAGAAIDISLRSYYLQRNDGNWTGVNSWKNEDGNFRPEYCQKLVETVAGFKEAGYCNAVVEHKIIEGKLVPSVLHICVNPDYGPTDNSSKKSIL